MQYTTTDKVSLSKLLRFILIAVVLVLLGTECRADAGTHLETGLRAYREADFDRAISELQKATELGLKAQNDQIQAHLYLGFAYIGKAERRFAEIEFAKAIQLDPTLELDPKQHSTKIITAFSGIKERMVDTLMVVSVPGGAEVYLDVAATDSAPTPTGVTPLTLDNVLIGNHTLRIVRGYFKPQVLTVRVEKGKDNRVQVQLEKAEIELRITSQPPEAAVFLADKGTLQTQPYGRTPVSLKAVLDQEIAIKLAKEEFHSKQLTLKLTEAGVAVSDSEDVVPLEDNVGIVHIPLKPAPPPGSLRVISDPTGATVRLDGIARGKTPLFIARVTPGTRRLRISMSGFTSATRQVEVVSNQQASVQVELGGLLHILSIPDGAQVFIDEKYAGLTPLKTERLPAGSHQLRLAREQHRDSIGAVLVERGQEKEVTIRLLPTKGSVAVSSDPPGAAVYLDGESKGTTPLFIYGVIVGRHSLKLARPGYGDWERQITVEESKVSWQFRKLKAD
jgi:hypothetical protein